MSKRLKILLGLSWLVLSVSLLHTIYTGLTCDGKVVSGLGRYVCIEVKDE